MKAINVLEEEEARPREMNRYLTSGVFTKKVDISEPIEEEIHSPRNTEMKLPSKASLLLYTNEYDDDLLQSNSNNEEDERETLTRYTLYHLAEDSIVNPIFKFERETENHNIRYTAIEGSQKTREISSMSLNLFLKKICFENFAQVKSNQVIIQSFIEQCSSFIRINVLFEKIENAFRYVCEKKNNNISGLMYFSIQLINNYFPEVIEDELLRVRLVALIDKMIKLNVLKEKEENDANKILQALKERKQIISKTDDYITYQGSKTNMLSLPLPKKDYFDLNSWSEESIAQQLTIISYSLLSQIKQEEIIAAKFSKKDKKINSPNVFKIIERFDNFILFIVEDIISYDYASTRAQMIAKWINVAEKCREYNNFTDAIIINTAFCNYIIRDLKQTWSLVPSEANSKLKSLKDFCSSKKAYAKVKNQIAICMKNKTPFVPYLGLLLKEIAGLEEKMKYVQEDTLVNFDKIKRVSTAINSFFKFKQMKYQFELNDKLEILETPNPLSEKELSKLTSKLEPSFTLEKKKKTEKRKTHTDLNFNKVKIYCTIPVNFNYFSVNN